MFYGRTMINRCIEQLEYISNALLPVNDIGKTMLENALQGKVSGGTHGQIQADLLKLHKARALILKVIEILISLKN